MNGGLRMCVSGRWGVEGGGSDGDKTMGTRGERSGEGKLGGVCSEEPGPWLTGGGMAMPTVKVPP